MPGPGAGVSGLSPLRWARAVAGEFPLPVWPWVWMPVLAVTGQPPPPPDYRTAFQ